MCAVKQRLRRLWACGLVVAILLASIELCIGQGSDQPSALDILGGSSSGSSSGSSQLMQCTDNINHQGSLPVAKSWRTDNAVVYNKEQLTAGVCAGYEISAKDLARTACGDPSPNSYILLEFWQLSSSNSSSSSASAPSVPDSVGGHVSDVLVAAAKGVQPWVNVGPDGHIKMTPPLRDADAGVTPVGTFEDDDAMVYGRAVSRMLLPTNAVVVDLGEPLDPKAWYITIANMPGGKPLPGYAIRATCLALGSSSSSSSSSKSKAAAANDTSASVPCPVPTPGGKECSGRGICRSDPLSQTIESSTYCDCDTGFGSWACQLPLPALPINTPTPTVVTVGPGQWGYWEVTLPAPKSGLTAGPRNGASGSGTSGDPFAAAAAGLGAGLLGNEALMVTAVRIEVDQGFGGKPLLFLKPFMTKEHNEPFLDALDSDISKYSDLRSYQLPLNKQYILTRLPLQSISTTTSGGTSNSIITYSMPRRWYVAIFNSNSNRLSQPVKIELQVQYRDLNRQPMVCPFNCSGAGRCVDPLASSMGSWPYDGGVLGPMAMGGLGSGGRSGADAASISTAIGPMQDQSPVDAGFMCACDSGFGGLTCEGRVQSVTVGNGEQHLGPENLNPGAWFFYLVTVDQGFNPQSQNLGIQWTVGTPSSPPSNYTNAFISFDQGPMPRQLVTDQRAMRPPAHKPMTPYTKLIVQNNPPLPLQVPGGQLSPGGSYVVSIYNNDFVTRDPYQFTIMFFVVSDQQMVFQPYMSILLGVTAAVILCLAMTLCKRLVMRWGIIPWRWRQRRQQLAAAAGVDANGTSLALVLMAQQQQQQQSNRGVPAEVYQTFPCRPFCAKEFQQRQQDMALRQRRQQQQQQDDLAALDQVVVPGQPAAAAAAAAAAGANAAAADPAAGRLQAGPRFRSVISGLTGLLIHHSAAPQQQQQQHQAEPPASVQLQTFPPPPPPAAAAGSTVPPAKCVIRANSTTADLAAANPSDPEVHSVNDPKDGGVPGDELPSCTVCLCEYVADEMVRQLPCGHEFHQCCIDQWMANHGTCPICRAPLWSGAFEPEDTQSDSDSESNNNNSAAIYVHHDMPSGGFRRSRRSTLLLGVSNSQTTRQSNSGRSSQGGGNIGLSSSVQQRLSVDGGGGAAAAAGAGVGGVMSSSAVAAAAPPPPPPAAAAAGGGGGVRSSSRFSLSGQPPLSQRLSWQSTQQQQQQQQQVGAVEQVLAGPGSAAAQQQQQQQQQRHSAGPVSGNALQVDASPAVAADTRQQRQQQ